MENIPLMEFKSILLVGFLYEVLGMYFQKAHPDCPLGPRAYRSP